jgi:hypothetical protein
MDYAGILTTTAQSLAGYVVDGIHNGSVLPARFLTQTRLNGTKASTCSNLYKL